MTIDETISMEPVEEKLRELEKYMPRQHHLIYQYAAYLADRLNPELEPMGFVIAANLALHDLQFEFKKVRNKPEEIRSLMNYDPSVYNALILTIPRIAKAVCPEEFAKGVQEVYKSFSKNSQKGEKNE